MQSFGCSTVSTLEFVMSPSTRTFGRSPAVMCRSDAPRSIISSRRTRRLRLEGAVLGAVISLAGGWDEGRGTWDAHRSGASRNPRPAARSGACLPNQLFHSRDSLQPLHPRVHAEREHAFLYGAVADLGRPRVHDDETANLLAHRHDLVDALPALESRAGARVATRSLEKPELSNRRVERRVLETGQRFLRRFGLRVGDRFVGEAQIAQRCRARDLGAGEAIANAKAKATKEA